ncbi:MAG: ATP-dependent DNA helicase [Patescibacteria group bacterium]
MLDGEFFEHEIHGKLLKLHDSLQSRVAEFERMLFLAPEKLLRELDRPIARLDFLLSHLSKFLSAANTGTIRILSKRDGQSSKIITTPLAIGPLLAERLWKDRKSVIATSATLAVGGSFDYITGVLSLSGFDLHVLKTDFNYAKQALLYIPSELGDVRKENEKRAISDFVRDIILIFGGRTLMLFTAFTAIKEMTLAVAPAFKSKGIQLLTQGLSGGKHKMIGEFMRQSDRSVLFGTESFWEGVDFPGESLELLIIHKFPFAVPTDPIFMARSKLYNNAFRDYALPAMIIKLRQGIGRLIRTKTDK